MLLKNIFNLAMLLFLLNSCSYKNKFNLEEQATIKFKKAYYQEWISGLKGGGSGINIHLVLADSLSENIKLKGIFFQKKYSPLKLQKLNYYQGFIKGEENWDKEEEQFKNSKTENTVIEKEKITSSPFDLKINEAVVSYLENNNNIKYFKINLLRKGFSDIPM